jgi:hypothetical protein
VLIRQADLLQGGVLDTNSMIEPIPEAVEHAALFKKHSPTSFAMGLLRRPAKTASRRFSGMQAESAAMGRRLRSRRR